MRGRHDARPRREPGQADQPMERVVDVAVEQPGPGRGHQQRRCAGGRGEFGRGAAGSGAARRRSWGAGPVPGSCRTCRGAPPAARRQSRRRRGRVRSPRPTRIPVTASNPISVANVARRSGVRSEPVAAISAAMSASEYRYGLARCGRCGSRSAAGTSCTGSSDVQVGGEPAHRREPVGPPVRAAAGRLPRPVQRRGDGDRRGAGLLEVVEELAQQLLRAGQPVAQRAAQREVVGQLIAQRAGHDTPHGRVDRPGPGQHRERVPVDLGVDRRGQRRAVPQHLPDLGAAGCRPAASRSRRCAAAGARGSVPRPARCAASNTTIVTPPVVNARCGACTRTNTLRPCRGAGPAAAQIRRDRRAHLGRQRQPFGAVALAQHRDLAAAPVDVVQPEAGDLAGAQPQPRPAAAGSRSPADRSGCADHRRPAAGAAGPVPGPSAGPTAASPRPTGPRPPATPGPAGQVQPPQQRPQRADDQLRRPDRPARTRGQHEPGDLARGQPGQIQHVTAQPGRDERPHAVHVAARRPARSDRARRAARRGSGPAAPRPARAQPSAGTGSTPSGAR